MSVNDLLAEGSHPVVYQVHLPLSMRTLILVTSAIGARRADLGTRWRKATAFEQAKLALAHLRHDQRLSDLAVANGVSVSTISRWVDEVVDLMARRAPRLDRVLAAIAASGQEVVLLDGTLVRTRRRTGRANRPTTPASTSATACCFSRSPIPRATCCGSPWPAPAAAPR